MPAASPRWGAAVGIVIGVALAAATSAAGVPHRPPSAPAPTVTPASRSLADAEGFLAAWARSRSISYAAQSHFDRTVDGRPALSTDGLVARQPPQWVERQGGTWTALLRGQRLECDDAINGRTRCVAVESNVDYRTDVANELQAFRSWLVDAPVSYQVSFGGGCFVMHRVRPVLAPPLGDDARYCFDVAGVAVLTEITTATALDRQTLSQVRSGVTAQDLQLPVPVTAG
jgi:hypothetical protein